MSLIDKQLDDFDQELVRLTGELTKARDALAAHELARSAYIAAVKPKHKPKSPARKVAASKSLAARRARTAPARAARAAKRAAAKAGTPDLIGALTPAERAQQATTRVNLRVGTTGPRAQERRRVRKGETVPVDRVET